MTEREALETLLRRMLFDPHVRGLLGKAGALAAVCPCGKCGPAIDAFGDEVGRALMLFPELLAAAVRRQELERTRVEGTVVH